MEKKNRFQFGMFLVTIGIVYGDIGTSPLYVMKSILNGNGGLLHVNQDFIIGSLSLVIWTVTLLTTVKYVLIAMKADNHGEGGIFALYSLVRQYGKWLIFPAMLGGAALLADGVLTPAVTVTTAVEGLRSIEVMNRFLGQGQGKVVLITLAIICVLFSVQRAGTSRIGKAFGPVMLLWFVFLGGAGLCYVVQYPVILKAFNPIYAVQVLFSDYNKAGFMILGSVFLATTGAEALYSDMGHVGRENVYFSWPFVKVSLILSYLGQGAWILMNQGNAELAALHELNPFFQMLPGMLRPFAVLMSTAAAVIASQALITGSYTMVSEAIRLDLLPHLEIRYPAETKGQMFIGTVNRLLWVGCMFVVLLFRSGAKMEAAYGLSITITMIMTTVLIFEYLRRIWRKPLLAWSVLIVFMLIQLVFFVSSLGKIAHGGYVTVLLTLAILFLMFIWYRGTRLEKKFYNHLKMADHTETLGRLRVDTRIPLLAHNLVYLDNGEDIDYIDRDILYSIMDKEAKRASAYWFVSVHVLDTPYDMNYELENYGTDYIFRIRLNLGFKCRQKINVYLRQIVEDLQRSGEMPAQNKEYSIYGPSTVGTFKFGYILKSVSGSNALSGLDEFVLRTKYTVRKLAGSKIKWYGLETSSIIEETVPLVIGGNRGDQRIQRK